MQVHPPVDECMLWIHIVQVEEQDDVHFAVGMLRRVQASRPLIGLGRENLDVFEVALEQSGHFGLTFMVHALEVEEGVLVVESENIAQ